MESIEDYIYDISDEERERILADTGNSNSSNNPPISSHNNSAIERYSASGVPMFEEKIKYSSSLYYKALLHVLREEFVKRSDLMDYFTVKPTEYVVDPNKLKGYFVKVIPSQYNRLFLWINPQINWLFVINMVVELL